jgi:hypothetical protein
MRLLHPNRPIALGLDFGRVIMSPASDVDAPDSRFLTLGEDDALAIPPPADAFAIIARLVRHFQGRAFIVSKAGPRIQRLTREWLARHRFHQVTLLPPRAVHFCRERKDKRAHALKLGLTHFVDDRVDVLSHLTGVVPHRYLFGPPTQVPAWAVHVADWRAVDRAILGGPRDRGDHQ